MMSYSPVLFDMNFYQRLITRWINILMRQDVATGGAE